MNFNGNACARNQKALIRLHFLRNALFLGIGKRKTILHQGIDSKA